MEDRIMRNNINAYISNIKESNQNYNNQIENIKLKSLIKKLKKENSKILKAKNLILSYKDLLRQKDYEIRKLKIKNKELLESIQRLPKILKKIFFKGRI